MKKKYIAPGSWFSLEYPADWNEFEDTEDSFLFYNPTKWEGNFRISAYKGRNAGYARACMDEELRQTDGAKSVQVGGWSCVYSAETFQEEGAWYTTHLWVTGKGDISVECSFTVPKGSPVRMAEEIIASLRIRIGNERPGKDIIPVRVLEINTVNEGYEWAVSTVKKLLTKDFKGCEADIANLQQAVDSGKFGKDQRQAWENFGIAFGVILVNEMDGMDWVTVIDGEKEYPALRFAGTDVLVRPLSLIEETVKNNGKCSLTEEYAAIRTQVEAAIRRMNP